MTTGADSASRGATAPSRHLHESSPGEQVVGGLFFGFEAVRTASSDRDAPRMTMASSRVVPRRGGLITVHELHQTIREIGQELSIDDVRFSRVF